MDAYFHMKVRKGQSKERPRGHSRDHNMSMQLEKSRQMNDNGGRDKPTKRQARTEEEIGPEVNGSGPRSTTNAESAESSVETCSRNLPHSSSLSWHIPVDVQVWWGRMS